MKRSWPKSEQALWRLADRVHATRGTETEPDDWIVDAAKQVAITAAILRYDLQDDRNERAYCDVLAWMGKRRYNTNDYFKRDLSKRLHLRGRPRCTG